MLRCRKKNGLWRKKITTALYFSARTVGLIQSMIRMGVKPNKIYFIQSSSSSFLLFLIIFRNLKPISLVNYIFWISSSYSCFLCRKRNLIFREDRGQLVSSGRTKYEVRGYIFLWRGYIFLQLILGFIMFFLSLFEFFILSK